MVDDDIKRIQIAGVDAVMGEDAGGESTLQPRKTKIRIVIAAENELDEAVAESADTIVEKDRVGHECADMEDFSTTAVSR